MGMEIYNASGVMIFDGVRAPFTLQDKITVNGSQGVQTVNGGGVNASTYWLVTVNLSSATSVLAFSGGPASWGLWKRSGTQATFITPNGNNGNVLTIYSFGVSPPVRTNSGFEAFDPSGRVIFTSNDKPLKPTTTIQLDAYNNNRLYSASTDGRALAFVQNNKFAYVWNHREGPANASGNTYADYMMAMTSIWNGTIAIDGVQTRRVRRGNGLVALDDPYQVYKRGNMTVVDVTGY